MVIVSEADIYIRNYGKAEQAKSTAVPSSTTSTTTTSHTSGTSTTTSTTTSSTTAASEPTPLQPSDKPVKLTLKAKQQPAFVGMARKHALINQWNQKNKELMRDAELEESQPKPAKGPRSAANRVQPLAQTFTTALSAEGAATSTVPTTESTPASTPTTAPADTKHICVLCKRQFNSAEMLAKHEQLSDLHKRNLEAAKLKQGQFKAELQERKAQEQLEV